jgi:hypothetical protein
VAARVVRVTDVGWKARALADGAAAARVVAALSRSVYLEIAGEIVWLGGPGSTLHGRAILAAELPDTGGAATLEASFDLRTAREWRPRELPRSPTRETLSSEARRLAGVVERVGRPDGFGPLLVGGRPAFPLDGAPDLARSFLESCAGDDARSAAALGERLLGLGPGLTPAGDDLVGGALFAVAVSFETAGSRTDAWKEAAALIRARAPARTHRISAMLLGDLLDGHGYAPLHDLTAALGGGETAAALDAAVRLVRIGHSSGWDILTGFLGALGAVVRR